MTISVVIPTYNRGSAVRATINSVLSQDLLDEEFEVVVVDDGSTDDTFAVLNSLYGDNVRVRLFSIDNGGVARARNFGLEQARGEFIAFLDHDDLWLPQKLRLQLDVMRAQPDVGVVSCLWREVDEDGNDVRPSVYLKNAEAGRMPQGKVFPQILGGNFIISMTLPLVRASLLRQVGGFDAATVPSDDWDLWIRLAQVTRFFCAPEVLAHYVSHSGQQHMNIGRAFESWLVVCGKYSLNPREYPVAWIQQKWFKRYCRAQLFYPVAKNALFRGDYGAVVRLYGRAVLLRIDAAVDRRWVYLLLRALRRNTESY